MDIRHQMTPEDSRLTANVNEKSGKRFTAVLVVDSIPTSLATQRCKL